MRCISLRASRRWHAQLSLSVLSVLLSVSPAAAGPSQPEANAKSAGALGEASAGAVEVSWSDIAGALNESPWLAAGRFDVDAARAGVDAAGEVPNPTLEATVGFGRARVGVDSGVEWGLALTIPFGWVAQRGPRIDAAEAAVDVAEAESKRLRRDVLVQLRTLFWSVAYEQARVEALETLEAQTAELVATVSKRVEKDDARPVEGIRAEIELEKVLAELAAARTSLAGREAQLGRWLGVPRSKKLVVVADLEALPVAPERDMAPATLGSTHPALEVARARTRVLEAEVEFEQMARIPAFSVTGFTSQGFDVQGYGAGIAVDLPIWNWNSGRIAQAEATLASARKQTEAMALEVDTTVVEAEAACRGSVLTAKRLGSNVLPRSEATASTTERTYQLGEASLLEVLDARRTLLESRRLLLGALAQAQIDCSRLSVLAGEEPQ